MVAAGEPLPSSATGHAEWALAVVAILSRLFAPLMLLAPRSWPLFGVVTGETVAFALVCLNRRAIPAWAARADMLAVVLALWPGGLVLQGAAYNYMSVAIPVAGLAPWSLPSALGVATVAAAAATANRLAGFDLGEVPDVLNPIAIAFVSWVIARSIRVTAAQLDERWRLAAAAAAALAEERERVRRTVALRGRLVSVMEWLAGPNVVADERVRGWLREETEWLRRFVATGAPEPTGDLLAELRKVLGEKESTGLRVHADWPPGEPRLRADRVHALSGAVREALTNVTKHAGTTEAWLTVRAEPDAVAVEISDHGKGFDPATTPAREGGRLSIRQRILDVGGRVEIDSAPGAGTRVLLWVPEG